MCQSMGSMMKSQLITRVICICPLGTMIVCRQFHSCPLSSCPIVEEFLDQRHGPTNLLTCRTTLARVHNAMTVKSSKCEQALREPKNNSSWRLSLLWWLHRIKVGCSLFPAVIRNGDYQLWLWHSEEKGARKERTKCKEWVAGEMSISQYSIHHTDIRGKMYVLINNYNDRNSFWSLKRCIQMFLSFFFWLVPMIELFLLCFRSVERRLISMN